MKTVFKYTLSLAGILMFGACGDDSSSSSAQSNQKFILDEKKQKFAIIYDRCFIGDGRTRWDENVDTTWFRYKFIGDSLIVIKDRKSVDCENDDDCDEGRDEGDVYVGGHSGSIFGTWKTTSDYCNYENGKIWCQKDKSEESDIIVLDVSKNNLAFSWELNNNVCITDKLEDEIKYDIHLNEEEYLLSKKDCNTIKIKTNGKTITATETLDITDNVSLMEITYTSGSKICSYTYKRVLKFLQQPKSLCNTKDMEKYLKKEGTGHLHKYQVLNNDGFYPCLEEMLGVDYDNNEDYDE